MIPNKRTMATVLAIAAMCSVLAEGARDHRQSTSGGDVELPQPTGPFAVGRVTVHWRDASQADPLASNRRRELMVDIWYPADPGSGSSAPYLNTIAFEQALGADGLKGVLGNAYAAIEAGHVRTHAREGVPFARSLKRSPVLTFSHGLGTPREIYTAQVEDLASHGYVVAAITHTYEATLTVFPDGRLIRYDGTRWSTPSNPEESNLEQLQWWADDIRFVVTELDRHNRDRSSSALPFAGRLDMGRVGAFGHSKGGQGAARACQTDSRFRACLNQDGLTSRAPFYLDAKGWGMEQAFLLIARAPPNRPPTDEELAQMKQTRQQLNELIARLEARQNAALRSTGKGSYRVFLDRTMTNHMSFTDLPLLQSADRREADTAARILSVVRNYTRTFFDKILKGAKAPLLDGDAPAGEFVDSVQKFEPDRRGRHQRR